MKSMLKQQTFLGFALCACLWLGTQNAKAGETTIPLGAISEEAGQAISIQAPTLDGFAPQSATLSVIFKQAGEIWADTKRANLALAISQDSRIIAEAPLQENQWAYDIPLPAIPSGLHLKAALIDVSGHCSPLPIGSLLDLTASRLRISTGNQGGRLDAIPALLGPAFAEGDDLDIYTPHGLDGPERLATALAVAEDYAVHFPGKTPGINVLKLRPATSRQQGALPGVDTSDFKGPVSILIGTISDLDGWVSENILSEVTGPYIGIQNLAGSPDKWLIIVAGRDRDDLRAASRAFADPTFIWPKGRAAILGDDHKPDAGIILPGVVWGPDHASRKPTTTTFSDLGYGTSDTLAQMTIPVMSLAGAGGIDPNNEILVNPSYIYAPGLQPGASLQAFIDDRFMGSIPLSPEGGDTTGTTIRIPLKNLRPGVSDLKLVPVLPQAGDACLIQQSKVPSTWQGDGTVEAPFMGGGRIRASLSAWSATGHLNPAVADRHIRMVIESSDDPTVAAALTIAARMAKAARMAIPGLALAQSNDDAMDADLILIGTAKWTAGILKHTTNSIDASQYPALVASAIETGQRFFAGGDGRDQVLDKLAQDPEAARSTILFGWSLREGQSVVAATFPDEARILTEARRLVQPQNWERLTGDYAVLPAAGGPLYTTAVANPDASAATDDPDPFLRIHSWMLDAARTAQGRVLLAIFGAIILLAVGMRLFANNARVKKAERSE